MPNDIGERLASIESIVIRIEQKQDDHAKRISALERAFAYAAGAVTVITSGIILYVKSAFSR